MFGKTRVSQSILDAVNSVIGEEPVVENKKPITMLSEKEQITPETLKGQILKKKDDKKASVGKSAIAMAAESKKRMLADDDLDETGFHMAAHAAKKSGASQFEFQGKKYPVTAKSHTEEYELDEDGNCVTPMKAKNIAKKEVKGHEKEMHKESMTFKERLLEKSVSTKQARTMAAAAHNPSFAKKVGIPQDVAKDFNKADKGTKMLSKAMKGEEVELDEMGDNSALYNQSAKTSAAKLNALKSSQKTFDFEKKQGLKAKANMTHEETEVTESLKDVAKKILSKVGHPDDKGMRKDLQKKVGVPQTGEKPMKKEEFEYVYEANIEPTAAKSRTHIGNLSHPIVNSVNHPKSGKEIGLITKQPDGKYHAFHSAAKPAHAQSGTFDNKDKAHQFVRDAHAKAIKSGTLKDKFLNKEEVEGVEEAMRPGFDYQAAAKEAQQRKAAGYERSGPYSWKKTKTEKPEEKKTQKEEVEQMYEDERDPTDDVVKKILKNREKYAKRNVTGESDPTDIAVSQILKNREKNAKLKKKTQKEEVEDMEEGVVGNLINRGKEAWHTHKANKQFDKIGAEHDKISAGKTDPKIGKERMDAMQARIRHHGDKAQAARLARTGSTLSKHSSYGGDQDILNRQKLRQKGMAEDVGLDENAFTDYKTDKKPSIFSPKSHTAKKTEKGTMYTKNWSKKDMEHKDDDKMKKEAVDKEVEKHVRVDGETDMNTKTVDMLRGRVKVSADYHNKSKSYKVAMPVGEEMEHDDEKEDKALVKKMVKKDALKKTDESFKGPEAGSGVGDHPFVTSEAKPLKNARELAKKTIARLKNEMLGKISN